MAAMNISRSRSAEHYLQAALDGNAVGAIMRLNSVVLQIRSLLAKGRRIDSESDFIAHATAMYHIEFLAPIQADDDETGQKTDALVPAHNTRWLRNLQNRWGSTRTGPRISTKRIGMGSCILRRNGPR